MKTGGGGGTSKLVRKKDAKPARGISSASAGSVEANKRRKATRGGLLKAAPNGTVPGYTEKEEGKFTGAVINVCNTLMVLVALARTCLHHI